MAVQRMRLIIDLDGKQSNNKIHMFRLTCHTLMPKFVVLSVSVRVDLFVIILKKKVIFLAIRFVIV